MGAAASPRRDEQGPGAAPSSDGAHVRDAAGQAADLGMGSELTLADIADHARARANGRFGSRHALGTSTEIRPVARRPAARPAFSKTFYFGSLLTEKYPGLKDSLNATESIRH